MNERQKEAVDVALRGHSFLLMGSAGTGKSFTIERIAAMLKESGENVQITCATGIACSVYGEAVNACTVHRFLGLLDGRYGPTEINRVHASSSSYEYVNTNLKELDCLLVDECSMISQKTFETIISVIQSSKKDMPQLIFCADFLQLPPVSNTLYQDPGKYCFQSNLFGQIFQHRVVLTENTRIHNNDGRSNLMKMINEVFSGALSNESEDLLRQLNRPLDDSKTSVKLFSKNERVDDFNRKKHN